MKTENICETVKQTDKAPPGPNDRMEAIARGVQARFEERMGYSQKVTYETTRIARSLGVPASEIERWANSRLNRLAHDTEKIREIKSLLNKV
jgi:HD-GYP domain-containing protein (c-di-GMP phosphodiesterase class II)